MPGPSAKDGTPQPVHRPRLTDHPYPALDSGIQAGMTNRTANRDVRRPGRMPGPSAKDGTPQPVHRPRLTDHPCPALDSGSIQAGMTDRADNRDVRRPGTDAGTQCQGR